MSTPNFCFFRVLQKGKTGRGLRLSPAYSDLQLLALVDLVEAGHDHAGEGEESNNVGQDDEVVEHIGDFPDEVTAGDGAQEDEYQGDNGVDHVAELAVLAAEKVVGVDLTEQVPAEDGREGKEQQADGHELGAQAGAEYGAESRLGQVGLAQGGGDVAEVAVGQRAVSGVQGADNDQGIQGQDDEGVNEHTDHGHDTLIVGVGHIGLGVGVGRRAHTGLIREEAALGTLGDRGLEGVADTAADDGLGLEGILEDHAEGGGDGLDAGAEDHQTAQQEDTGHNRHQLLGDGGKTLHTAQEDDSADDDQDDTHDPGGDAEGRLHGGADGVGLDHAAHEAKGQDDGDGEEARQELSEASLERRGDVVDWAALDIAVRLNDTGLLGQGSLGIDSGHAEEGDDPHPEDSAGAAGEDSAGGTHDVAGAHLGGDGGGQRLEGGHAAFLGAAAEVHLTEKLFHALAEATDLDKAGLDRVPQAHTHQQEDEDIVAEVLVDLGYDGEQYTF